MVLVSYLGNHYLNQDQETPGGFVVKNPPTNAGDMGSIPGSGRSPRVGNGSSLYYFGWEIPWTEEPSELQGH